MEYDWGAIVNFKKVSDPNQGKKGKGNPTKSGTKVQVDLLLHVISNDGDDKDTIPIPCAEDQVRVALTNHILVHDIFVRKEKWRWSQFLQR